MPGRRRETPEGPGGEENGPPAARAVRLRPLDGAVPRVRARPGEPVARHERRAAPRRQRARGADHAEAASSRGRRDRAGRHAPARRAVRARAVLRVRGRRPGARDARERLRGFRPPLAPDPFEALVTSICAQQVSLQSAFAIRARFVEAYGERAVQRGRSRRASASRPRRGRPVRARLLAPQGGVRARPRALRRSTSTRLPRCRTTRCARRSSPAAGSARGRPSGSSHGTSRGRRAWPAGDLALRKAVARLLRCGRGDRRPPAAPVPEPRRALPADGGADAVTIRRATEADEPVLRELWSEFEREVPAAARVRRDVGGGMGRRRRRHRRARDRPAGGGRRGCRSARSRASASKQARTGTSARLRARAARRRGRPRGLLPEARARAGPRRTGAFARRSSPATRSALAVWQAARIRGRSCSTWRPARRGRGALGGRGRGGFGSIHVQTDDRERGAAGGRKYRPRHRRPGGGASSSEPRNGWVAVYDEVCERDPTLLQRLARELSYATGAVVVAFTVEREAARRLLDLRPRLAVDELPLGARGARPGAARRPRRVEANPRVGARGSPAPTRPPCAPSRAPRRRRPSCRRCASSPRRSARRWGSRAPTAATRLEAPRRARPRPRPTTAPEPLDPLGERRVRPGRRRAGRGSAGATARTRCRRARTGAPMQACSASSSRQRRLERGAAPSCRGAARSTAGEACRRSGGSDSEPRQRSAGSAGSSAGSGCTAPRGTRGSRRLGQHQARPSRAHGHLAERVLLVEPVGADFADRLRPPRGYKLLGQREFRTARSMGSDRAS